MAGPTRPLCVLFRLPVAGRNRELLRVGRAEGGERRRCAALAMVPNSGRNAGRWRRWSAIVVAPLISLACSHGQESACPISPDLTVVRSERPTAVVIHHEAIPSEGEGCFGLVVRIGGLEGTETPEFLDVVVDRGGKVLWTRKKIELASLPRAVESTMRSDPRFTGVISTCRRFTVGGFDGRTEFAFLVGTPDARNWIVVDSGGSVTRVIPFVQRGLFERE